MSAYNHQAKHHWLIIGRLLMSILWCRKYGRGRQTCIQNCSAEIQAADTDMLYQKQGTKCPFLSGGYHLAVYLLTFHVSTKSWHLSRKAYSSAVSFNLSKRPDCEKWPAPKSHLKSRMRLSVLFSLNLATNFAGSLHINIKTAEDLNTQSCPPLN